MERLGGGKMGQCAAHGLPDGMGDVQFTVLTATGLPPGFLRSLLQLTDPNSRHVVCSVEREGPRVKPVASPRRRTFSQLWGGNILAV